MTLSREKRLRPTLAADKNKEVCPTQARTEPVVTTLMAPANPAPKGPKGKKKKKKKGAGKVPLILTAPAEPRPLPPAPTNLAEGWNVVAKRGAKKKATPVANPSTQRAKTKPQKAPKLRRPRSQVVVLKVQPAVADKLSYTDVLTQVKENIKLEDLGISDLRFRVASTGARMLELPGANTGEKADALAKKLRGVLRQEEVQVSRPVKCAELRVSGLDDSATSEDVMAAISQVGGCAAADVKVGEIRQDRAGLGTAWARCPVGAAQKVSGGRLLVEFVSTRVQLLQPRIQRCYRCHEAGYMAAKCTSEVDRSNQCIRCGQRGHQQRGCSAEVHCPVREAAQRPANHKAGSAVCAKSSATHKRGGKRRCTRPEAPASTSHPAREGEVQHMDDQ